MMKHNHSVDFSTLEQVFTDNGILWEGQEYTPLATFVDTEGMDLLYDGEDALEHYIEVVLGEDNCLYWLFWEPEIGDWDVAFIMPYDLQKFVFEYFVEEYPQNELVFDDESDPDECTAYELEIDEQRPPRW